MLQCYGPAVLWCCSASVFQCYRSAVLLSSLCLDKQCIWVYEFTWIEREFTTHTHWLADSAHCLWLTSSPLCSPGHHGHPAPALTFREAHSLSQGPEVTQTTWGTRRLVRWVTPVLAAHASPQRKIKIDISAAARDLHFAFNSIMFWHFKCRDTKLKNYSFTVLRAVGILIVKSKKIDLI